MFARDAKVSLLGVYVFEVELGSWCVLDNLIEVICVLLSRNWILIA
jgi:hypothetical protein